MTRRKKYLWPPAPRPAATPAPKVEERPLVSPGPPTYQPTVFVHMLWPLAIVMILIGMLSVKLMAIVLGKLFIYWAADGDMLKGGWRMPLGRRR